VLRKCLGKDAHGNEYIQTVSKRGYRFVGKVQRVNSAPEVGHPPSSKSIAPSIAVLVLDDMSALRDQEYFCEGMSEEIITRLMRVPGLRVASRTSSFRFRGQNTDVRKIGEELGVSYLLEGSVRKAGDRLRIVVQLVQTEDGFQLWSHRFDRRAEDVFEIQDEIASAVAKVFELSLSQGRMTVLVRPPTADLEAYQLYLQGRYYWNKRPGDAVNKSLECFERAIERDPKFALAHVGVADVYNTLGGWESGVLSPAIALAKAKSAAERALSIDPNLAEAHTSLAYAALHYDRDPAVANALFENAAALNPHYIHTHHWHSHCLIATGRIDESLVASRLALTIDPVDLIIQAHLAWHYFMANQPDAAVDQCHRLLNLEQSYPWGHYFKGCALALQGEATRAVDAFREALRCSGDTPVMRAGLGYALALNQERRQALDIAAGLTREGSASGRFSYEVGLIQLALGEQEQALESFSQACDERSGWGVYLNVDPRLEGLKPHPRFAKLVTANAASPHKLGTRDHN
jgi:TolB-like protein/Tfp pilus assembly protein PilF